MKLRALDAHIEIAGDDGLVAEARRTPREMLAAVSDRANGSSCSSAQMLREVGRRGPTDVGYLRRKKNPPPPRRRMTMMMRRMVVVLM